MSSLSSSDDVTSAGSNSISYRRTKADLFKSVNGLDLRAFSPGNAVPSDGSSLPVLSKP